MWLDIVVPQSISSILNLHANLITQIKDQKIRKTEQKIRGTNPPKTGASGLFMKLIHLCKTAISYQEVLSSISSRYSLRLYLTTHYSGRLSFPSWITDPPGRSRMASPMTSLGRSRGGCCGRVQRHDVAGEEDYWINMRELDELERGGWSGVLRSFRWLIVQYSCYDFEVNG